MVNVNDADLEIARAVGAALSGRDKVGRELGIQLEEIRPGYARMRMTVTESMINGHDICHGAYIFALGDTACAYASNSFNRNALSQGVNIVFMAPTLKGTALIAEASETGSTGRTGIYDVKIGNESGETVALFRGQCRVVNGKVVEDLPA